MERPYSKKVQTRLLRALSDLIILRFLDGEPMHGYKVISKFRKTFGVYFGPSTIYPLLNALEREGYVKSEWETMSGRPRRVYRLTATGKNLLGLTEETLDLIRRKLDSKVLTASPPLL